MGFNSAFKGFNFARISDKSIYLYVSCKYCREEDNTLLSVTFLSNTFMSEMFLANTFMSNKFVCNKYVLRPAAHLSNTIMCNKFMSNTIKYNTLN